MSQMTEEEFCHWSLDRLRRDYEQAAKPFADRLVRIKAMAMPPITFQCAKGHTLTSFYNSSPQSYTVGCKTCGKFGAAVMVGSMGNKMAEMEALKNYLKDAQ